MTICFLSREQPDGLLQYNFPGGQSPLISDVLNSLSFPAPPFNFRGRKWL